jgi:hypothetical protein
MECASLRALISQQPPLLGAEGVILAEYVSAPTVASQVIVCRLPHIRPYPLDSETPGRDLKKICRSGQALTGVCMHTRAACRVLQRCDTVI